MNNKINNLEEAAYSYVNTTIECFDSEGNPCCYPAFIAGAQWQEEKLSKAVKLADAMYYAAQMLSTDASHLRKATEAWWQFKNVELKKK